MWCWAVVIGSGSAGAAPAGCDAAGGVEQYRVEPARPGGERDEGAEREALGTRGGGHEAQLDGAAACAGTAQGELPGLVFGEIAGGLDDARLISAAIEMGEALAAARPPIADRPVALRRRARERASEASQGSRVARSRAYPDMRRRPFWLCVGAYGVSCRARAMRYATDVAIRPRSPSRDCLGSPAPPPRGEADSARTGAPYQVSVQDASHRKGCTGSCRRSTAPAGGGAAGERGAIAHDVPLLAAR